MPTSKKQRRNEFIINEQVTVALPEGIEEQYGFKINKVGFYYYLLLFDTDFFAIASRWKTHSNLL